MKLKLFLVAIITLPCFLLNSCNKETESNQEEYTILDEEKDLKLFSIILSRAVSNEPSLRAFIKEEALKQFDKDFDVFYPWVKDQDIDGRSFRDILLLYDKDGDLASIESARPLLNILVPDWSWIDDKCFSVYSWKTEENYIGVTFRTRSNRQILFTNGEVDAIINKDNIPSFPVIIVKENERMVVKHKQTKGSCSKEDYAFFDDAFINEPIKRTKDTWGNYWYVNADVQQETDSLPSSIMNGRVATTINHPNVPHRDHIYYGMTESCDSGRVDYYYKETIKRIKLNSGNIGGLYDDNDDIHFKTHYKIGKNSSYTVEQLKDLIWADGSIELLFVIEAGEQYNMTRPYSVSLSDAFQINKFKLRWKYNWIGAKKSLYAYIEKDYLVPKWIDVNLRLFTWDVKRCPKQYVIKIYEKDSDATITAEEYIEEDFMKNYSSSVSGSYDTIKYGYNLGGQTTEKRTIKYTYSYTQNSDLLDTIAIPYEEPVICGYNVNGNFKPYTSNGQVIVQMIPTTM